MAIEHEKRESQNEGINDADQMTIDDMMAMEKAPSQGIIPGWRDTGSDIWTVKVEPEEAFQPQIETF